MDDGPTVRASGGQLARMRVGGVCKRSIPGHGGIAEGVRRCCRSTACEAPGLKPRAIVCDTAIDG